MVEALCDVGRVLKVGKGGWVVEKEYAISIEPALFSLKANAHNETLRNLRIDE